MKWIIQFVGESMPATVEKDKRLKPGHVSMWHCSCREHRCHHIIKVIAQLKPKIFQKVRS